MYVEISLFKTTFDEENIFVGNNKNDMETVLNSFPSDKRKDLPRSPFNLKYPFRIAANYFEVSRKYNYARYKFFNTQIETTPVEIRYYFVRDYLSIDDTSCEIAVREDILAKIFYDLQYPEILPDRYTYKWNSINNKNYYTSEYNNERFSYLFNDFCNIEKVPKEAINSPTKSNDFDYMGMIIITFTAKTNGDLFEKTTIDNINYPIGTILIPFLFDNKSYFKGYELNSFYYKKDDTYTLVNSAYLYYSLFSNTENSFKIISTNVTLNIGGYFSIERRLIEIEEQEINAIIFSDNDLIKFDIYNISSGIAAGNYLQLSSVNSTDTFNSNVPVNYQQVQNNSRFYYNPFIDILEDEQFLQEPFYKIVISNHSIEKEINPLYIKSLNYLTYSKSFIPPYNVTINYTNYGNKQYQNNTNYTMEQSIIIDDNFSFIDFTDAFAEFLRNNYNSLIIGQQVRRSYEWAEYGIKETANITKNITSIKGNLAMGGKAGNIKAKSGIINTIIDPIENASLLGLNQAKENALLDLVLKDKKNTANDIALDSNISLIFNSLNFILINVGQNIALNTYKENIKRYGVKAPYRIKNIKAHENFDYIRITDIIFNNDSIALSENERQAVEKYFNDGVRLWYDYEAYKDFTLDNPELLS